MKSNYNKKMTLLAESYRLSFDAWYRNVVRAFLPLLWGTAITTCNLKFDPNLLWKQVEDKKVTNIVIVGDAFAEPMLEALNEAN